MSVPARYLMHVVFAAAVLVSTLVVTGCDNPFSPRLAPVRGVSTPPPVPNQDVEVIRLFAWCWNNRAYQEYTEIFTDDFRFQFAALDSAGSSGRGDFLTRSQELDVARHLFVEGSATEPPATSIDLTIDPSLISTADSRDKPGARFNPKWHREILTSVLLRIKTESQEFQVTGHARFFVVRGDSAAIPTELQAQFHPDSTRWWISRWEDETDEGANGASAPREIVPVNDARVASFGTLSRQSLAPAQAAKPAGAADAAIPITWTRLQLGWLNR